MTLDRIKDRRRSWSVLVLIACCLAPLSEYVHASMLDHHVPYPFTPGLPGVLKVLDVAVRLAAAAFFTRALLPRTWRERPVVSALLGSVLVLMLNETLRVIWIDDAIEQSLPAALLEQIPKLAMFAEMAVIVYAAAKGLRWLSLSACILVIAVLGALYATPWLAAHAGAWSQTLLPGVTGHYNPPYPGFIMRRILIGFLEPTIATFVLVALCWRALPGTTWARAGWFTLFLLLLRGRIVTQLLFSLWVKQRFPVNYLAESQFFLETAVLAFLTGLAWGWFSPDARNA